MRVEVEDISSVEKKITVTIPKESVITEFENAYRNLKKRFAVKGFRQGKVPRDLLERHYKKEVEGEVVTKLINDSCFKSLEENGITPVSPPVIDNGVLEEGKEFTYSAKIEVKPEIEVKGYIGMELEKEKLSISNEDIEKKLAELQQVNAQLQEVDKRRAVKVGDFAVVDYEGFLGNEAIEGEKVVDHVLEVGSGSFLPKFEEQLVGLKKGDKKDILVTVPEDHSKKDLAAKEVTFRVEIKGIKEKIIHELNDDFAKDLGEFETLAELRERIKENLERQGRVKVESELKDKILDRLVEENPFEVPSSMVTQHLQYMINETEKRLAFQGLSMEKAGISLDGLRENYKNQAEKEVRGSLLLEEIGKKESIEVDEKEIEDRIVEIANRVGQTVETVRDYYETKDARERLRSGLMTEKTLDFIINSAKIEEVEKSKNDTDPNSD